VSSTSVAQPVPREYNAFAYVIGGKGSFGSDNQEQLAHRGQIIMFDKNGQVEIKAADNIKSPLDVFLIAGKPLNEPIAHNGQFVMNKREEIIIPKRIEILYNLSRMSLNELKIPEEINVHKQSWDVAVGMIIHGHVVMVADVAPENCEVGTPRDILQLSRQPYSDYSKLDYNVGKWI